MEDPTSLLLGLDTFAVADVMRVADGIVQVVIETRSREAACPACGVLSSRVKDRPLVRVKDLPASGQQVALWWRKRRLVCVEPRCPRRSFTQVIPEGAGACQVSSCPGPGLSRVPASVPE